jgi:asparagine synthase (glutamine-hydrolysing)
MCGIYGQYNYATSCPVNRADIETATRTLAHRGPDDEGYFLCGPLGLGFRRLSIIDLAGGHQPMSDDEQSHWVVFNGEIYNFVELRTELQAKGHTFRTLSDTEVIVHGYREWGEQCLDRLRGMFGLAVWDVKKRKLLIARDAMGIKPVYYRLDSRTVFFSSEVRALMTGRGERPELDPTSVNLFLRHRYTPSPRTLFRGIQKLAPGTMLVVESGVARIERWYTFTPAPFSVRRSLTEAADELLHLYRGAVRRHLISDVPVGLLLSGGIDSALLLALMRDEGAPLNTYSVGYGSAFRDDELKDARTTAALFGSRHVEVEMSRSAFEAALPAVVQSLEEPVAASSIVPMYVICARAGHDVKVALVGQGPDELFGGYTRHLGVHYGYLLRAAPLSVRRMLEKVVTVLPRNAALKRGVYSLGLAGRLRRYREVLSVATGSVINGLFRDGVLQDRSADAVFECWRDIGQLVDGLDELAGFQWLELQSTLPDELLMYTDKMSMAHGLEVRVPYLDRSVVEYAQRLDATLKIRWGTRKIVHRTVCANFLPPEIIRRKKRGFAANVVDDWFNSSLNAKMDRALRDDTSLMYDFLDPKAVHRLLDDHKAGRKDNHKLLFSLVVLEEWMRGNDAQLNRASCRRSG